MCVRTNFSDSDFTVGPKIMHCHHGVEMGFILAMVKSTRVGAETSQIYFKYNELMRVQSS